MNARINTDLKSLRYIFNKNKPYIFSIATIIVSIILFFQFVIPQFNAMLLAKKEAEELRSRLDVLRENLNILTNVNENTLDSQVNILNQALPLNKDFIGILKAAYSTAQETGVSLGGFSVEVGDLSESVDDKSFPVVKLSIPIYADIAGIDNFVKNISKAFPLAEAYSVKIGNLSSSVGISFYYKPLSVSNYSQDVPVNPISQKGLTLINQLKEFQNEHNFSEAVVTTSTSSATQ